MSTRRPPRHRAARQRPSTFARVRALLAGALVLGVGATMTLAAWTDEEYARAQITAGTFALESQTAVSTPWSNHSVTAATLSVDMTGLYPGQSRAAWMQIRTAAGSVPGTVSLTGVTNGANGAPTVDPHLALWGSLKARIGTVASTGACTTSYAAGAVVDLASVPTATQLPAQTLDPNQGNIVTYCIVVTLPADAPNEAQGGSVTPVWEFTGSTATS